MAKGQKAGIQLTAYKRRWYFPLGPSLEKEVKAGGGVTAGIWKVCSLLLFK